MALIYKQLSGGSSAPTIKLEITPKAYDIENNRTPIDYKFSIDRPYEISSTATKSYTLKIGSKVISGSVTVGGTGTKVLKNGTVYIDHDQDGTKTINFSFSINIDITWSGVHNGVINSSANVKLPSIPIVTTPTLSVSSVEMGQSVMIKMERATSKFTHKLKFKLGKREIAIADNLGVSYTWQVPLSLANYIPNATSQKGVVVCETYLAGDLVGSKGIYLTLSVPNNITPTISSIKQKDVSSVTFGAYIQNQSKLQIDIVASGAYNSEIIDITTTLNGVVYKGNSFITNILNFNNAKDMEVIVTDTRGRKTTEVISIEVVEWYKPKISDFRAERCDSKGNIQEDGESLKITYSFDIATVLNKNNKRVVFGYAEPGDATFTNFKEITNLYNESNSFITNATFSADSSYLIRMTVYDTFTYVKRYDEVETDITVFDIYKNGSGIAFGKVAELEGYFDNALKTKFRDTVEFMNDREWTNIPLSAEFKAYDTEQIPQYRIKGNVVEIKGAVSPVASYASTNERKTFGNIPSKYAPQTAIYLLCQGSSMASWLFSIQPTGALTISRYGKTALEEVPINAWLPFQATYTL
jgi:hypothetical protein|nr:MAG TPA: protein of unknown function DUF859 [Caudoviricetes sp.]